MQENRKKTEAKEALALAAERGKAATVGDTASSKLKKLATSVGNEEVQKRIEKGNAGRDELLKFLFERLKTMRKVQMKEMKLTSPTEQRKWWKKVADTNKEAFTKPDPKRWREPAKLYEEAARELAQGRLGRGKKLVQDAIDAEKTAFKSMTRLVKLSDVDAEVQEPEMAKEIAKDGASAGTDVPPEILELARRIQLVEKSVDDPPVKKRVKDPWWTEEEEEEEDESAPA